MHFCSLSQTFVCYCIQYITCMKILIGALQEKVLYNIRSEQLNFKPYFYIILFTIVLPVQVHQGTVRNLIQMEFFFIILLLFVLLFLFE